MVGVVLMFVCVVFLVVGLMVLVVVMGLLSLLQHFVLQAAVLLHHPLV